MKIRGAAIIEGCRVLRIRFKSEAVEQQYIALYDFCDTLQRTVYNDGTIIDLLKLQYNQTPILKEEIIK